MRIGVGAVTGLMLPLLEAGVSKPRDICGEGRECARVIATAPLERERRWDRAKGERLRVLGADMAQSFERFCKSTLGVKVEVGSVELRMLSSGRCDIFLVVVGAGVFSKALCFADSSMPSSFIAASTAGGGGCV